MPNWSTEDCGLCGHPLNSHVPKKEWERKVKGVVMEIGGPFICEEPGCECRDEFRVSKEAVGDVSPN